MKSNEIKTGRNVAEFSKEGYGSKWALLSMMISFLKTSSIKSK
jgi:hypothetical protein